MWQRTVFAALIVVALLATACTAPVAAPAAQPQAAGGPDKVVIWSPGDNGTVADWNTDPILAEVEKATNTDIEMVKLDWGTFVDQTNAAIASGKVPDIIGVIDPNQRGLLEQWVADGVIVPFEGDAAAAAPNVLKPYAVNPSLGELKVGGKVYFQPVSWGDGQYPNMGLIHVRKDLLDKYGMAAPDTFQQYFDYLKKCIDSGDGSGVVFAGSTGVGPAINAFAGAQGAPMSGWAKTANGFEFWATQPGIKDALLLFREMMAQGLVDPGVWEMDGDKSRTPYVSGSACSLIFNGGGHIGRIQNDMALVNPSFQELLLPALDAGKGSRGYLSEPMFWGTTQMAGMKNNNPVAAARVLNYLTSPEGLKLTAVGIEGRDYAMKDGEIVLLDQRMKDGFPTEAGNTGAHPLASTIVSWVPQDWQNWQLLYGKDAAFKDWFNAMWDNQGKYQIPSYGLLTTSPKWNEFQATSNDLVNRAFLEIVKADSAEAAAARYDQFVKEWQAAGGADAQTEMSAVLSGIYK